MTPFFPPHRFRLPVFSLVALLLALLPLAVKAQLGVGTTTPHPRAALDIQGVGKGLLIPRMDSAQRAQIGSPPDGLLVFQTDGRRGFWYAVGGAWTLLPDQQRATDNLGNHTATRPLNLGTQPLTGGGPAGLTVAPDGTTTVPGQRVTDLGGTGTRLVQTDAAGRLVAAPPVTTSATQPTRVGGTSLSLSSVSTTVGLLGNYAYLVNTAGNSLDVYDVSNPALPVRVTGVGTGTFPQAVVVAGSYAYVLTTMPLKIETFDLSNPASPVRLLPTTAVSTAAVSLAVAGGYLYLAGGTQVQTVSLANPAAPTAGVVLTLTGRLTDIEVQGAYAYVVDNQNYTFQTLSLANPAAPALVHTVSLAAVPGGSPIQFIRLALAGTRAYAVDPNTNQLITVDLTNPAAPAVLSTLTTQGASAAASGRGLTAVGANVYVLLDGGLRWFDGTASLPVAGAFTTVGPQPLAIVARGDYGYVSTQDGLAVVRLSTPAPLFMDATGALTAQPLQLTGAAQGTQYTLGIGGGNTVTFTAADNLGNHTATQNLSLGTNTLTGGGAAGLTVAPDGTTTVPGQRVTDLSGTGTRLVQTDAAGRLVAAPPVTTSANQPTRVGGTSLSLSSVSSTVGLLGNYAYLVNTAGNSLDVYDVSNPALPARVGGVSVGTFPQAVVVAGSYAYVLTTTPLKIETFDLSNPASPVRLLPSTAVSTAAVSLAVAGGYLYLAGATQVQTVSLATPTAPTAGAVLPLTGRLTDIEVQGGYAYLTDIQNYTLHTLSLANPAVPALVNTMAVAPLPSTSHIQYIRLALAGTRAYAVDPNTNQLITLDLTNPAAPAVLSTLTTQGASAAAGGRGLTAVGPNVYVLLDGGLRWFDGTASLPVAGAFATVGTQPLAIVARGDYGYVSTQEGLAVVRLTTPAPLFMDPTTGALTAQPLQLTGAAQGTQYTLGIQGGNTVTFTAADNLGDHTATQNLRLNDPNDLLLRTNVSNDNNHGLGWYGTDRTAKPWNGVNIDGPVLYGYSGGALGANRNGTHSTALRWDQAGNVAVGGPAPGIYTFESRSTNSAGTALRAQSTSAAGTFLTLTNSSTPSTETIFHLMATGSTHPVFGGNKLVVGPNGGAGGLAPSVVIDGATRNVGIGTSTPAQALDVNGTTRTTDLQVTGGTPGVGKVLTADATGNATWQAAAAADNLGNHTATQNLNLAANQLVGNGGTAGLRISSGGLVGINTTATAFRLELNAGSSSALAAQLTGGSTTGTWLNLANTTTGATGFQFISTGSGNGEGAGKLLIFPGTGGGTTGTGLTLVAATGNLGINNNSPSQKLDVGGNIRCVSLTQTSDVRFKRDIRPVAGAMGLIRQLRGVRYYWKPELAAQGYDDREQLGFLAQELKEVLPQAVTQDAAGYYSVDYSKVVPVLVEALKEQQVQMEALQKRLEALERR